MEVGGVKWGVYSYYATSIGILATFAIIVFYLGFQGFQVEIFLFFGGKIFFLRLEEASGSRSGLTIPGQGVLNKNLYVDVTTNIQQQPNEYVFAARKLP